MKSTLENNKKELEMQKKILCAFIIGNIDELMNLMIHSLITKLWCEAIMLAGLPANDYDCFYLAGKDCKKKLKKFYAGLGIKGLDPVSFHEMKDLLKWALIIF